MQRELVIILAAIALGLDCVPASSQSSSAPAGAVAADAFAGLPADSTQLVAVHIDVGQDAFEPSVSPDGRLIAFHGWTDVFLYDVLTKQCRLLCRNSNPHQFVWNPSGTKLAFEGDDTASTRAEFWIWLVNVDGSALHRIKGSGPDDRQPIWHRDGRTLVWSRHNRLWQSDTGGVGGRFISKAPGRNGYQDALGWTSDGNRVVYLAGSEHGADFTLRVAGRDSSEDSEFLARMPPVSRWQMGMSADGGLLYRGAGNTIEIAEPGATGRVRRYVLPEGFTPWDVSLALDRSFAVFSQGDEEQQDLWLVRLKAPGKRQRPLVR